MKSDLSDFKLFFLALFTLCHQGLANGPQQVSCGSVVKLVNVQHKVRLHSHDVKYGSGSGQQSVTGTDQKDDVNSHWAIKGPDDKRHCERGQPIKCGQEVRFEHLTTHRNLHSHHFRSPLSNSQEISAFGDGGHGDSGDVWSVVCDNQYWNRDDPVLIKHLDTGAFLGASGQTFGRPIHGQMEIVGLTMPDVAAKWKTMEGVYVHASDFNPKRHSKHDEL